MHSTNEKLSYIPKKINVTYIKHIKPSTINNWQSKQRTCSLVSHLQKKENIPAFFPNARSEANGSNRQPGISPSRSLINIYNSELHPTSPRVFFEPTVTFRIPHYASNVHAEKCIAFLRGARKIKDKEEGRNRISQREYRDFSGLTLLQ
ncbi:hypothetical protein CDAR_296541 [Caerostris darwini]|uniref:Uncharacterized protein n=1 Tax=Caerostris darwini TaxID=1538125 RepID=A0AAV4PNX8_9ARAC|nr:hypothetical protein CDAR_296541 [Caerostris darwini]